MVMPMATRFQRTGDTYLMEDSDVAGGYRTVADINARNNIPLTARRIGMTVYCVADKIEYQLINSLINASWTARPLFVGKAHSTAQLINVGPLQQFSPLVFEQYAASAVRTWFNNLPAANRKLDKPVYFFKIVCATGTTSSLAEGTVLPPETEYLGDCTFVYDAAGSSGAVTLVESSLICLSKNLIPLGDPVISAMNEYADRMVLENP